MDIKELNKVLAESLEEPKKAFHEEHSYTKDEEENNRFVKLYKKCYEYRKEHPEMEAYEIANKLCFNPNEDWVQLDEVAKTWADMFVFDGAKDEELIKTVREDIVEMIEEYLIDDEENGDFENETEFEESLQKKSVKEDLADRSALYTVKGLALSMLDPFEEDDCEQQLEFCKQVAKQIVDVCNKVL